MKPQIVLLDNFDSFTYNLVDELRVLGYRLVVYRNVVSADHIMQQLEARHPNSLLLLSPGPGMPQDAGCMQELLVRVQGQYPVFGICLGHQAIIQHYGGKIVRSCEAVHGKSSAITHCGDKMFSHLPHPLKVARYHSLIGVNPPPPKLKVIASYENVPMAVYHEDHHMLGFQFHPESILTVHGSQLLKQSIEFLIKEYQK